MGTLTRSCSRIYSGLSSLSIGYVVNDNGTRTTITVNALRLWAPIVASLITTLLVLGMLYGKLGGRLDLIEYRLGQIEKVLKL